MKIITVAASWDLTPMLLGILLELIVVTLAPLTCIRGVRVMLQTFLNISSFKMDSQLHAQGTLVPYLSRCKSPHCQN